uniref:Plexin-B1 n=1 Tax=Geotrypetes seraphini TaxID=260995 RepID=A0A6P8NZU2_GEOSA|nr:plexin-B1 [Geotrypetes seraphini]XP_033782094.1 plexin-B1 [Geotrypetes seraphini]XP_033782095.1 plexin-B1 [Geotrypetes seraphini]XP_033782096.1 plexin-B1 [Geotrypetes seraphini]
MPPGTLLLPAICFLGTLISGAPPYIAFSQNNTRFNHLTLDPKMGTLYLGATNFLFQLTPDLRVEDKVQTGPVLDSKDCLPPVSALDCPQAYNTDNHNKLLLVSQMREELIVCGSVHQGICEKRSLQSIKKVLFRPERPVDTQYVAANDPNITTVGLVGHSKDGAPLLFVGRGYTSKGAGGISPITTRNLDVQGGDLQGAGSHSIFSYEDTAKLAVVGRLSEYNHHFIKSFTHRSSVYFLFYRRNLKAHSREYKTYISRICPDDSHYYSYVELPLSCRSQETNFNLVQAAYVGHPGAKVAQGFLNTWGEVLFAVFSTWQSVSGKQESALCVFSMEEVDRLINRTRDLCYTKDGKAEDGVEVAYIEYDMKSNCVQLPSDTLDAYPCGSDHTPSPMASRMPLEAVPVLEMLDTQLTAVAVHVEGDHTVAFLGDSRGHLHKVYLGAAGESDEYTCLTDLSNTAVCGDLLFDQSERHLYVMTQSALVKVPVAECSRHTDCLSCLSERDPYCGWCVLQGRCSRRSECSRSSESDQWLWSFDTSQQCLVVQSLNPSNISREEKRNIFLFISDLPVLREEETYSCYFEDYESAAVLTETGAMCPSPDPSKAPAIKPGTDHVKVKLLLRFGDVVIAAVDFVFYDCMAVALLSRMAQCQGCVSSDWGCNWCVQQHLCTHKATCEEGAVIYNKMAQIPVLGPSVPPVISDGNVSTSLPISGTPSVSTVSTTDPITIASMTSATAAATTTLYTTVSTSIVLPTKTPLGTSNYVPPVPPTTANPTTPATFAVLTTVLPTEENTTLPLMSATTESLENATTPSESTTDVATFQLSTVEEVEDTEPLNTAVPTTLLPRASSVTASDEEDATWSSSISIATAENAITSSSFPSIQFVNQTASAPSSSGPPEELESELPTSELPPTVLPDWLSREVMDIKDIDDWVESSLTENDTSPFSSSTLLSGDGDLDGVSSSFSRSNHPVLDYQNDPPEFYELNEEEVMWGPGACPCVHGIQGSSLLPVNVERKITLLGKNFHLYQDEQWNYECVLVLEGQTVVMDAFVEADATEQTKHYITCQLHQYSYSAPQPEFNAVIFVQRQRDMQVDSSQDLYVTLYNCSVGHLDCSRCQTADPKYDCVWCGGEQPSCVFQESCADAIEDTCPAPLIHSIDPLSGPVEGGSRVTITGSNLGQKPEDIANSVTVAGVPCTVDVLEYEISSSIVCVTGRSQTEKSGHVAVEVPGGGHGVSAQVFSYQDPTLHSIFPTRGPKAGGTSLTLTGSKLLTGRDSDIRILLGDLPCHVFSEMQQNRLECRTSPSNTSVELPVTVTYGEQERRLAGSLFRYTPDPNITSAGPAKSFLGGGRVILVYGQNLDVVQAPKIRVVVSPLERRRRGLGRQRRIIPETECPENALCSVQQFEEVCLVNSSFLILCKTPAINLSPQSARITVEFILDNLHFDFSSLNPTPFSYEVNPVLKQLNAEDPAKPYRHKPGSVISVEGENLDLAVYKDEMVAMIGEGVCIVKTLTRNHLYCEPPSEQPSPRHPTREGMDSLPEFMVQIGNLKFMLGRVQYDTESQLTFPLAAQIGLGVGASFVALIVLIIVLIYRRKSKQALRDYKKVQIQLENLETSVRDRCKKEFTDLMTEMMDLTSDLVGTRIPFLDYKTYAERIFFPGHRESPLQRDLDVPECRRQTVEQGLVQLSNLLNSKLFLTKFIHTLESQRTFSPRDRAYVASLLTVSLHGKLEYFTDILKTLLNDLVEQYVAKNPKLMLRRTETVVEKLLTNWMSICLYAFVRDSAGEPLYMLFRGIKHQVDKGPVDGVTGKAKYTLNDNRLLRDDVEYRTLTLNAVTQTTGGGGGAEEAQGVPVKVLDCDTITQVKEKVLDHIYKGTLYCHRPDPDTLDLEWRSGLAGHLILSDEDLTSVVQGSWKRVNTLQHYKVPDGAAVALVPRLTKHIHPENHDYIPGEKTPMLEDADEGGIKLWHLVKPTEEPELPKHRRGSLRDRERAKAIPEIYLTRLLSMKGTLQKFVDDLFQVILSTSRPVPLAVKYFFDLLDEQAVHHGITDSETIHIWKTNSLPLRFWINIIKNPQFIFDVQTSDNVDAVLSVIAQTFMDSCTIADHKLGRDSPINKLLYARDIPRYKQMVERYYADIRQTISASDQEMNSALAELSRNYSGELNSLVALHELYKYINKYYDQIITALEEDSTAQKMQLGYRLQQIAAAVENKVTDL